MNNLKRLLVSLALTSVLAVSAVAGDMPAPPGETTAPPCVPGEMNSPPCPEPSATTSTSNDAPGELSTPPASDASDISAIAEALEWALALL